MSNLNFVDIKDDRICEKQVKNLYKEAFPKEEKMPIWCLKGLVRKNRAIFYGIYDKEKFVGLVYLIFYEDIVFLFYFAIEKELRGQGYGSQVLKAIQEKYAKYKIILNIEEVDKNSDNYEQRYKRKLFYHKNGFQDLNCTFKEGKVAYEMLYYHKENRKVSIEEYKELMREYLGKILYHFYKKVFRAQKNGSKSK